MLLGAELISDKDQNYLFFTSISQKALPAYIYTWARLFKTDDVVSFVKFSEVNFSNMPIFFLQKCGKLLQCKSFSHFFKKNTNVVGCKVVKHELTSKRAR